MKTQDISHDLRMAHIVRRACAGGTWVCCEVAGHVCQALVFPEHAVSPNFELDNSRISKLWIRRERDQKIVCSFERGWDIHPATRKAAAICDFLTAGLADHVYGKRAARTPSLVP